MKLIGKIMLAFTVAWCLFSLNAFAQEEDLDFTYGYVTQRQDTHLTVEEYDIDTDQIKEIDYWVNANTKFENANTLQDIEQYDSVEIEYQIQNNKRMAVWVTKDVKGDDEDEGFGEEEDIGSDGLYLEEEPVSPGEGLSGE